MALVATALAAVACGDDDDGSGSEKPRLVVSAAASMTEALTECAKGYPDATCACHSPVPMSSRHRSARA